MRNLRKVLSYTLYFVLAVVLLTSCNPKPIELTTVVSVHKSYESDEFTYWITTDQGFDIYTNISFNVGDTLYLSKYNR